MEWRGWVPSVDSRLLVFLDETGAKTDMIRAYGRAPMGQRVTDYAPGGHWNTTTLVAALKRDGVLAPMVLDGPMDSEAFEAYVQQVLIPELPKGAIVVMDNLGAHKSPRIAHMLEQADCYLRYLPPYSPDLNPIEQMWAKVKSHLKAAKARTQEALIQAIAQSLDKITAEDTEGFFLNESVGIKS